MDDHDYRLAALRAWHKATQNADQALARQYRTLAQAYLTLARFHDRAEQPGGRKADIDDNRREFWGG